MIDGLAEMLPAHTVEFTARGRTWRMGELTARDYAEISAHLISKRPHPLDAIKGHLDGLSEDDKRLLLGRAFDAARRAQTVNQFELNDFLYSAEGTIFAVWLSMRKYALDLTYSQVEDLFIPMCLETVQRFQTLLDQLYGLPVENPSLAAGQVTPTPTASQ